VKIVRKILMAILLVASMMIAAMPASAGDNTNAAQNTGLISQDATTTNVPIGVTALFGSAGNQATSTSEAAAMSQNINQQIADTFDLFSF
jgi:hypothetical protein